MKDFFVMLSHPSKNLPAAPLQDDENEVMFFETAEQARAAAESSWLGAEFGYEVFELGAGE